MKGSFEYHKSSPNKRRMKFLLHLLIAGIWSFNLKANVVLAGTDDDGFFDDYHHDDDGFFDDDYHDHNSCYDDWHFRYESDHAKVSISINHSRQGMRNICGCISSSCRYGRKFHAHFLTSISNLFNAFSFDAPRIANG